MALLNGSISGSEHVGQSANWNLNELSGLILSAMCVIGNRRDSQAGDARAGLPSENDRQTPMGFQQVTISRVLPPAWRLGISAFQMVRCEQAHTTA